MILITGANGVVGTPLCQRLQSDAIEFMAVSRRHLNGVPHQFTWNMEEALPDLPVDIALDALIHCAPLWLLAPHIESLAAHGLKRVVAFSSTSIEGKQRTRSRYEQTMVALLSDAESSLKTTCIKLGIELTLLRPSLIYGYQRDQNVSRIARTIKRFGVLPVVGQAQGLRQPVHADDLVHVAISALSKKLDGVRTYTVVGGETLSYEAMVRRIFASLDKSPRLLRLPAWLMRAGLWILGVLTAGQYTPDMADRMNQDLAYDDQPARVELGYQPRDFYPQVGIDV